MYSTMNIDEAAGYLHMDMRQLQKLVARREVPHEQIRGRIVFRKHHLRDWASTRILNFKEDNLNDYHKTAHKKSTFDESRPFLHDFVDETYFIDYIPVKSKAKIIRYLANRAFDAGHVCDAEELTRLLLEREELGSTGLEGGVAIPHTKEHSEYLFLDNFMLVGRFPGGVPFGALDGKKTDLFFLPCTMDDELHLYTISRIAMLIQKTDLCDRLRTAYDSYEMFEIFMECEEDFVERVVNKIRK